MRQSELLNKYGVNHGFLGCEHDFTKLVCNPDALDQILDFIKVDALYMPVQVHGNKVASVCSIKSADAVVTKSKGVAIAVRTADCIPVLFYDHKMSIIGVAHVGWRGALLGVIQKTLMKMFSMGSLANDILVAMGPAISQDSYEVGKDVKQFFEDKYFRISSSGNFHFDLVGVVENQILSLNIKNIDKSAFVDTYSNQDFFSYRKCKNDSRNISYIAL